MTDKRFQYYTGYEEDNEPSDDEDENENNNNGLGIKHSHVSSESSSDEFDKPIREFIEKNMSRPVASGKTSTTKASSAFVNEMEDELDTVYHTFLARGTFELPISIQKPVTVTENDKNDSDDDDDDDDTTNKPIATTTTGDDNDEKFNDDLLYDPEEEDKDEKWMTNERIKSRGGTTSRNPDSSSLGNTDAVLNCPGCMVLISHDCQRHETNRNQYRAMFVFNCTVDESRIARVSIVGDDQQSSRSKKKKNNKRFKSKK